MNESLEAAQKSERKGGRGRRLRRGLLALSISGLLALVIGELIARVLVGTPLPERLPILRVRANELRGWEMLPSERHYTYMHPVEMNSLGLRGPELASDKGAELRVLALGDSLIYGQGVADADTVPAALELALAEGDPEGRSWRVVNAGHRGYATNQEVGLLRELGPLIRPDVVVLFWYSNDLIEPDVELLARRLEESGPVCFDTKSRLEGTELFVWRFKQLVRRSALVMLTHDVLHVAGGEEPRPDGLERGFERFGEQLIELEALCTELGASLLVVHLPEAPAVAGPHHSRSFAARLGAVVERQGLTLFDCTPPLEALRESIGHLPVIPYDGHYDAAANRCIAESLTQPLFDHMRSRE